MKKELVSVIIPTYYRNDYLNKCLESVYSQSYENIEVIVIDDSGESAAAETVQSFEHIKYISFEKNRGPNAARNAGIESANGEYIQLLDDDDRLYPSKIQKQVRKAESSSDAGVIYCGLEQAGQVSYPRVENRGKVLKQALMFDLTACVTSTMLIDKKYISMIHPLPDVAGSDDTYWKIMLANQTQFEFVNEILVKKGDSKDQRSESIGAIEGTWNLLNQFEELYLRYPAEVYKNAYASAAAREGRFILSDKIWSKRAVYLFALAAIHHSDAFPDLYVQAMLSAFGAPGKILFDKVSQR